MRAAERFVPLAVWLRGPGESDAEVHAPPSATLELPTDMPVALPASNDAERALCDVLRDCRLFRARLADALDAATRCVVREFAYAVLARELHAAPADLAALAARIITEHPAATPLVVRHAPGDDLDVALPRVADPALESGDLIVQFSEGDVDARFGVRLDVALEAWS